MIVLPSVVGYQRIKEVIASDPALQHTYTLLTTIKGVGLIVASYMICCTNNFIRFNNARQFNCYAGIAPFKYESGTSLKGRARVSNLANKDAKTLLNMAAFSAIRYNGELREYYQKRVSEGKPKMCCVNMIRSKIVARIFAVAKRNSPFVEREVAA